MPTPTPTPKPNGGSGDLIDKAAAAHSSAPVSSASGAQPSGTSGGSGDLIDQAAKRSVTSNPNTTGQSPTTITPNSPPVYGGVPFGQTASGITPSAMSTKPGAQMPTTSVSGVIQATPQQASTTVFDNLQHWNYKDANAGNKIGPNGESLPPDAKSWDPFGNPYFGDGTLVGDIVGKFKEWQYNATKDYTPPAGGTPTWQMAGQAWQAAGQSIQSNINTPINAPGGVATEGQQQNDAAVVNAIKTTYNAAEAYAMQNGVLKPIVEPLQAGIQEILGLFQVPAQGAEQAMGAYQGLINNPVQSPAPRLDPRILAGIPALNIGYNLVRAAMSPDQNRWQSTIQGAQTGKILYTEIWNGLKQAYTTGDLRYAQTINGATQAEFIRRMQQGENPDLLAMEMGNPIAEMVGQIAIDPLNAVGMLAKGAKVANELNKADELVTASGALANPGIADTIAELGKVTDPTEALDKLKAVTDATASAVSDVRSGLNQTYNAGSLIATGNQEKLMRSNGMFAQNFMNMMANNGHGTNETMNQFANLVHMASSDPEEIQLGVVGALHSPSPTLMFNQFGLTFGATVRNLLEDENGVVDTAAFIKKFDGFTNNSDFAEGMGKLLTSASESAYPTVQKMADAAAAVKKAASTGEEASTEAQKLSQAYDNLPQWVKTSTKITAGPQAIKGWVNKQLGSFYFGLQYSVASKYLTNNTVQILVDEGTGAFFRDGHYLSVADLRDESAAWLGTEKPMGGGGFSNFDQELGLNGTFTELPTTLKEKLGNLTPQAIMAANEEKAGLRIFMYHMNDSMKKLINPMFMGGDLLAKGGMDATEQAGMMRLLMDNHGDVSAAIQTYRDLHSTGSMDSWRAIESWIKPGEQKAFEEQGMWKDLTILLNNPSTTHDDITAFFNKAQKSQIYRAGLTVNDVGGVGLDVPGGKDIQALQEAVQTGKLKNADPNAVLQSWLQEAYTAQNKFSSQLEQTFNQVLREQGQNPEINNLVEMKQNWLQYANEHGTQTKTAANQLLQATRYWDKQAKGAEGSEELYALWKKIGLPAEVPKDVSVASIREAIWDHYRTSVSSLWTDHYTALFHGDAANGIPGSEQVLAELGKYTDGTKLQSDFMDANQTMTRAQAMRTSYYKNGKLWYTPAATADMNAQYAELNKKLFDPATPFDQLPEIRKAMSTIDNQMRPIAIPPAFVDGSVPSYPRAIKENLSGMLDLLQRTQKNIESRWGQVVGGVVDAKKEAAFAEWSQVVNQRMPEAKLMAQQAASYWRTFALKSYGEKTFADLALSYVYPYQFWYSRTYANWVQRIATDPQVLAGYAKYKQAMADLHSTSPDWYKQQVQIPNLIGMDKSNPLYFNLEANLWPLAKITGTDFTDTQKRVDWWTNTLDDMNKFGPSTWAPIQIATAMSLLAQGQTDAASRWGGRLIPETAQIKALYNLAGSPGQSNLNIPQVPGLKYGELDPSVNFFSGGLDPYERGRAGRVVADAMQKAIDQVMLTPGLTPEQKDTQVGTIRAQYLDAVNKQNGPIWNQAVQDSQNIRAPGMISSYFLGMGFKERTQVDASVDDMYQKLNQLYQLNKDGMLTPDEYKLAYSQLSKNYPFMEDVLLARKGGVQRDSAFAYDVLARIPPGDTYNMLKAAGLSQDDINHFYATKGFTTPGAYTDSKGVVHPPTPFTDQQQQRFMSSIADLGALLKVPSDSTGAEWTIAKNNYQSISNQIDKQMPGIWQEVQTYYDLKAANAQTGDDFYVQHPEISNALAQREGAILADPVLSKYYGGIKTLTLYWTNSDRNFLTSKYGSNILKEQQDYYNLIDPGPKKLYQAQHPELKGYWKDARTLSDQAQLAINKFSQFLPEVVSEAPRSDYVPQNVQQQNEAAALQGPQQPSVQQLLAPMSQPLQKYVLAYAQTGAQPTKAAMTELDYIAKRNGYYDGNSMLQTFVQSYQDYQNQMQGVAP